MRFLSNFHDFLRFQICQFSREYTTFFQISNFFFIFPNFPELELIFRSNKVFHEFVLLHIKHSEKSIWLIVIVILFWPFCPLEKNWQFFTDSFFRHINSTPRSLSQVWRKLAKWGEVYNAKLKVSKLLLFLLISGDICQKNSSKYKEICGADWNELNQVWISYLIM